MCKCRVKAGEGVNNRAKCLGWKFAAPRESAREMRPYFSWNVSEKLLKRQRAAQRLHGFHVEPDEAGARSNALPPIGDMSDGTIFEAGENNQRSVLAVLETPNGLANRWFTNEIAVLNAGENYLAAMLGNREYVGRSRCHESTRNRRLVIPAAVLHL